MVKKKYLLFWLQFINSRCSRLLQRAPNQFFPTIAISYMHAHAQRTFTRTCPCTRTHRHTHVWTQAQIVAIFESWFSKHGLAGNGRKHGLKQYKAEAKTKLWLVIVMHRHMHIHRKFNGDPKKVELWIVEFGKVENLRAIHIALLFTSTFKIICN